MWISRDVWEQLRSLETDLASAQAEAEMAKLELATKQQTIDWLATLVNDLRLERTILFNRVLDIQLPVAEFVRAGNGAPAPVPQTPDVPPDMPAQAAAALARFASNRKFTPLGDEPTNPVNGQAELGAAMFEDMGDAEARRQGVTHDETGAVRYGR